MSHSFTTIKQNNNNIFKIKSAASNNFIDNYFSLLFAFLQMEMNENRNQQQKIVKRPTINKNNQQRRRFYTRRRGGGQQPLTFFVLLFSLISYCSLTTTECATFFYGATEDSESPEKIEQLQNVVDTNERALALAESAAAANSENEINEQKLSSHELESVYNFCSLLPLLEQSGQIVKNAQARQVCNKLVDMLKPMFRKRNKAIRPRRTNILITKRRK
uniref:Uncharacterized protein n=1 Tax=Meloidogyne enterolobii TaxID=390850 RepID=A0A6V7TKA5_MELEN|nr:unnamed protein product [Meloidogyne enterolobii]